MLFGDVDKFLEGPKKDDFDMFTIGCEFDQIYMRGQFSAFKNNKDMRTAFRHCPDYPKFFLKGEVIGWGPTENCFSHFMFTNEKYSFGFYNYQFDQPAMFRWYEIHWKDGKLFLDDADKLRRVDYDRDCEQAPKFLKPEFTKCGIRTAHGLVKIKGSKVSPFPREAMLEYAFAHFSIAKKSKPPIREMSADTNSTHWKLVLYDEDVLKIVHGEKKVDD